MEKTSNTVPFWMRFTLRAAAIYNFLWGAWVVLFPFAFFEWAGLEKPNYIAMWQAVGMIVACYGIAYWVASYDPVRHWGIVLTGFLGKLFGPVGFTQHYFMGTLPLIFGLHNISNDLIWLLPFGFILHAAYRTYGLTFFAGKKEQALEEV